jgi:hypothetical protein
MADETLTASRNTLGGLGMRYHELALQRWFNGTFLVPNSTYAIPVVLSSPMDAFGNLNQLFAKDGPFSYLFALKDENGTPLYEPYPSTLRYPLISIFRRGWKYRPEQSYGYHQFRHMNWPTVSPDVVRDDLAYVSVSQRPNAWDYRFQIDHYAMRPDTQAYFVEKLMRSFVTGGGTPQTWMKIHFPVLGIQKIRMYLDGDIENSTLEEPEVETHVEFRTTCNIVVEGYSIDQDVHFVPALWKLLFRSQNQPASPEDLTKAFDEQITVDLRVSGANPTLDSRPDIPPNTISSTQGTLTQFTFG